MGYTIYWEKKENFSDYEWEQLWNAFDYYSKEMRVGLDHIKIDTYSKYIKKYDDRIIFNGIGEDSCETFVLYKNMGEENEVGFCKTNRQNYGHIAWALLREAHKIAPHKITIANDDGERYEAN
jgi:hypothetical protein